MPGTNNSNGQARPETSATSAGQKHQTTGATKVGKNTGATGTSSVNKASSTRSGQGQKSDSSGKGWADVLKDDEDHLASGCRVV